jgi:hypothetical protein
MIICIIPQSTTSAILVSLCEQQVGRRNNCSYFKMHWNRKDSFATLPRNELRQVASFHRRRCAPPPTEEIMVGNRRRCWVSEFCSTNGEIQQTCPRWRSRMEAVTCSSSSMEAWINGGRLKIRKRLHTGLIERG